MTENPYIKNPHLQGDSFTLSGNKTGILLLHGFTATTAEVRLMAECLNLAGFSISAPLLPGHGTFPDDLNHVKWIAWYEAAEAAFLELRRSCSHVFVGGESMGSLLTLLLASRYTGIDGVMCFAPAIKIPKAWMAPLLKAFIPWQEKPVENDGLPWKGYNVNPVKGVAEVFKLQIQVRRELRHVTQPAIIFTGFRDKTIAPDSGQLIFDHIASIDKSLHLMPDSPHCILLDHEVSRVCELCIDFILHHTGND